MHPDSIIRRNSSEVLVLSEANFLRKLGFT